MKHKLGIWILFKDRKCGACKLTESYLTVDCTGEPLERTRLMAFQDGLCNYVAGRWVDWTGRPTKGDVLVLRQRYARQHQLDEGLLMAVKERRHPSLKRKMDMEDTLLGHQKWRGWNPNPFDD